jgi:2-dehydropantoate 2-reductase
MREVVAVGRALGVTLSENFAEDRLAFCDGLPAEMVASMHADLLGGRRLESPWLSGAIVKLGAASFIPTPVNRAIDDILALYVEGRGEKS